jgi:hypothetical protein
MTTPTPPAATPTLTLATDSTSYVVGQTLTLTATYADSQSSPSTLTITVTATDAQNNSVTATDSVTVVQQVSEQMNVTATDSFSDSYTLVSNAVGANGTGTAVLTTTVGTPPAS